MLIYISCCCHYTIVSDRIDISVLLMELKIWMAARNSWLITHDSIFFCKSIQNLTSVHFSFITETKFRLAVAGGELATEFQTDHIYGKWLVVYLCIGVILFTCSNQLQNKKTMLWTSKWAKLNNVCYKPENGIQTLIETFAWINSPDWYVQF